MNKQWKPGRQTVALQPSRIRRDPVQLASKVQSRTREQDLWFGVAGILLTAIACAILTLGISGFFDSDPADRSAPKPKFDFCYNGGVDCVLNGGTARIDGQWIKVAGMDVPRIADAACSRESERGIEAAVRLRELLNSGSIAIGVARRGSNGDAVRDVQVGGRDVAQAMIRANFARREGGGSEGWCQG